MLKDDPGRVNFKVSTLLLYDLLRPPHYTLLPSPSPKTSILTGIGRPLNLVEGRIESGLLFWQTVVKVN